MKFSILASAAALVFLGSNANAGEFSLQCYASINDCATIARDLVTTKFTTKYPSKRWDIVVIADFQRYSNGGGVGFAVAGVVPTGTGQAPVRRVSATIRIDDTRKIDANGETDLTVEVLRDAVTELMAACDRSSKCDIYTPFQ